jgi:cytochrome c556
MFHRASLFAVTAGFALVATDILNAQYELVQLVTDRREIMFEMQSAYWPLLEVMNDKSTDLAAAAAASQSIASALDRFSALLLPGTAKGEVPGTRATAEVWTEPDEFAAASNALKSAAAALTEAASSADIELFKSRFGAFESACVGCHDFKPSGGGKFRARR